MFGVFCMQYPDAGVGIIFVPVYIAAQYFLPAIMAFDLYGMTVGFKRLNLGHAVSVLFCPRPRVTICTVH
jgi:rhomboid-like protein